MNNSRTDQDGVGGVGQWSTAERAVVQWAIGLAAANRANFAPGSAVASWRYCSVGELLLDRGRLFTPGAPTEPLGVAKECFANAAARTDIWDGEVYVEGLASTAEMPVLALEHAWCATGTVAVDPTWPQGGAYLGIAFDDNYRRQRQRDTGYYSLLWTPAVMDLLSDGLPAGAVVDCGRPIPTALVSTLEQTMVGRD